jgi:hypothetical protein
MIGTARFNGTDAVTGSSSGVVIEATIKNTSSETASSYCLITIDTTHGANNPFLQN